MKTKFVTAVLLAAFATPALASDPMQALLDQATALYAERANPAQLDKALELLAEVEAKATDPLVKFDALILDSRALYWKGQHATSNDDKKTIHLAGVQRAEAARLIDANLAEAPYYAGANLGRWAEANGILESLGRKDELIKLMETAIAGVSRTGLPGATVDGYGPNRVLGRVYFKLPKIFGGSLAKAVKYQREAAEKAGDFAINPYYLAESLGTGNDAQQAEALQILDTLLTNDPNAFGPTDRRPETLEEFELARKLKDDLAG